MNKIIASVGGLVFFLASCQKDISNEKNGAGGVRGPNTEELLSTLKTDYGNAQIEVEFLYDAQNRLVRENQMIIAPGTASRESHRILVRNASGIVVKASYASIGVADSIIYTVNYNSVAGRYISSVSKSALNNSNYYDSAVYSYDASGKINEVDEYLTPPSPGIIPIPDQRSFYTFDASGNITYVKTVSLNYQTGVEEVRGEYFLTYDSSINPLVLPIGEAQIFGDDAKVSPNNAIKMVYKDILGSGVASSTVDVSFTYTAKNKPSTSSIIQSNGISYSNTYTYK